jgi:hypothetical protein
MAYVRKTETMLDDIVRKIRAMGDKALEMYKENSIEIDTAEFAAACEAIQTAAYREAPHLRGNLPQSWLFKTERVHLKVLSRTEHGTKVSTYLSVPEHRQFEVPFHMSDSWRIDVEVYEDECTGALAAWVQAHNTNKEPRRAVEVQYREVERQVVGFLRSHSSLNAAIKEMPEIELYIPDQYMAKLREANAPKAKKPEQQSLINELGIDRDALAAVAIAHRVMS